MSCGSHKHHHNEDCRRQPYGKKKDKCHRHHGKQHQKGCCRQEQPGCKKGPHARRHFLTKEEKVARLEVYLQELQTEAQAVQEQIVALQEA